MVAECPAPSEPPIEHVRATTLSDQSAPGLGWGRREKSDKVDSPTSVDAIAQMPLPGPVPIPGAVSEPWPPPNGPTVRMIDLHSTQRKSTGDDLDEIRPATADADQKRQNANSSEIPESLSSALKIQEEEDAALARRLAEESEWAIPYDEIFDKRDVEKGDAEFARKLFHLEISNLRPAQAPSKKCYVVVFVGICLACVLGYVLATQVPGWQDLTDDDDDGHDFRRGLQEAAFSAGGSLISERIGSLSLDMHGQGFRSGRGAALSGSGAAVGRRASRGGQRTGGKGESRGLAWVKETK